MDKSLFILGDSISIDITPFVKFYFGTEWNISRKGDFPADEIPNEPDPSNGGDSAMVLAYLKAELQNILPKTILLNCGLHDIKRQPTIEDIPQIPLEIYEANLQEMIRLIKAANKDLIWITTTPVDPLQHAEWMRDFYRLDTDVELYNAHALEIMKAADIPVIDLGGFTKKLEHPLYRDHVHFTEQTVKMQAAFLFGALSVRLNE